MERIYRSDPEREPLTPKEIAVQVAFGVFDIAVLIFAVVGIVASLNWILNR